MPILNDDNRDTVFAVMRRSIEQGLDNGSSYIPDSAEYPSPLNDKYAVFVTLKLKDNLRGCIGTTEAQMPLVEAAAYYAHAAAFSDPRFRPLSADEYPDVEISLSILTPATPMQFDDEQDLVSQLRPDIDGLIIEKDTRRATFLPVVWESLAQPPLFLAELKRKAGIRLDEAPDHAWRYSAEYYS